MNCKLCGKVQKSGDYLRLIKEAIDKLRMAQRGNVPPPIIMAQLIMASRLIDEAVELMNEFEGDF